MNCLNGPAGVATVDTYGIEASNRDLEQSTTILSERKDNLTAALEHVSCWACGIVRTIIDQEVATQLAPLRHKVCRG